MAAASPNNKRKRALKEKVIRDMHRKMLAGNPNDVWKDGSGFIPGTLTISSLQSTYSIINGTGTINNNQSKQMTKFSEGDRVVLVDGNEDYHEHNEYNPYWGRDGQYIVGVISYVDTDDGEVYIKWDNGKENEYYPDGANCTIVKENVAPKKGGLFKKVKLDSVHLDKLVLDKETKGEIVAVLSQHEHADKIFNEWGLGEILEYGKGMTMLFHGKPGTGKTWGANCIAKALRKELLVIDAANIQSSEPGGANRAIQQAFKEATHSNKVLFIDECDSLIYDRAHLGMVLGGEVNTLLTELERFEGVAILATNAVHNMDPALERRISLIAEFPEPDYDARLNIWKTLLPKKMPLAKDIDIKKLAEIETTGGIIKNIILSAARLAVSEGDGKEVTKANFKKAAERAMASKNIMGKTGQKARMMPTEDMGIGSSTTKGSSSLMEIFKTKN